MTGNLQRLVELYECRDREGVADLLQGDDFLVDVLLAAHPEIESYFGRDANLALEVMVDPEGDEEERDLVLLIETSLDRERARALLDSLDREWWLEMPPEARHRTTIDLHYR